MEYIQKQMLHTEQKVSITPLTNFKQAAATPRNIQNLQVVPASLETSFRMTLPADPVTL